MKKHLYPVLISLCVFGLIACTPQHVSNEDYRRTAIKNCDAQPSKTEYDFCVERAKMDAEEHRINSEKNT